MLLRQEVADRVDVLAVAGHVSPQDTAELVGAVEQALRSRPRGVVVDLVEVTDLAPDAAEALSGLAATQPSHRGRPVLSLCGADDVDRALPDVEVHPSRDAALARVERRAAVRQVVPIPHSPHGPAEARRAVKRCADALGLAELGHDLELVVSEMVTNAVRHALPPVELQIAACDERVVVAVADGSPSPPKARAADLDAEGGRGMALVDLLAAEHGVRADPPGKKVWAALLRRRRPRA